MDHVREMVAASTRDDRGIAAMRTLPHAAANGPTVVAASTGRRSSGQTQPLLTTAEMEGGQGNGAELFVRTHRLIDSIACTGSRSARGFVPRLSRGFVRDARRQAADGGLLIDGVQKDVRWRSRSTRRACRSRGVKRRSGVIVTYPASKSRWMSARSSNPLLMWCEPSAACGRIWAASSPLPFGVSLVAVARG